MKTLNAAYSAITTRRRYEVWFVRLGLTDGSGAWWFRYLLTNPGRSGCGSDLKGVHEAIPRGTEGSAGSTQPVQVWATWFPHEGKPETFIQGFPIDVLELSGRGASPFHFRVGKNAIDESSCEGSLAAAGHSVSWNLRYRSAFHTTLSDKGWIGFSRTPHSNAVFSGEILMDGGLFQGNPLGCGLQGHNCGYRHRSFWTWAHLYLVRNDGSASTFEALTYDMPLGMKFRKAVLWHESQKHIFRALHETRRDQENLVWEFNCAERDGLRVHAVIDGSGPGRHRLSYVKTDCSGSFDVVNNSLAKAQISLENPNGPAERFSTITGAVVEMVGHD